MKSINGLLCGLAFITLTALAPAHAEAKKARSTNEDICPIMGNMVLSAVHYRDLGIAVENALRVNDDMAMKQGTYGTLGHSAYQLVLLTVYKDPHAQTAKLREEIESFCRQHLSR